ncbi:MAG: PaaI family thioesterase [Phycisphaerales bacterium]|nr:MAG: PaaI family thioesterase [Phycisphaerales bacterium]
MGKVAFAAPDTGGVEPKFDCSAAYEGYDGILHGGVVASLVDGVMTNCLFARGIPGVTADLTAQFRHPIVTGTRAVARAWIERSFPPRHLIGAEIVRSMQTKTSAIGRFVEYVADGAEESVATDQRGQETITT